jgi:uncharacterized membrane protein YeaQ/YmgE (transglycosylase-associated protein family)
LICFHTEAFWKQHIWARNPWFGAYDKTFSCDGFDLPVKVFCLIDNRTDEEGSPISCGRFFLTNYSHFYKFTPPQSKFLSFYHFRRRRIMFHLIWYILIGLVAGVIAKSIMHVHLALIWTIVLGIIGSIIGGAVTHMFSRAREGVPFHPAGLIFSVLGSLLVLFLCYKLNIRFPN